MLLTYILQDSFTLSAKNTAFLFFLFYFFVKFDLFFIQLLNLLLCVIRGVLEKWKWFRGTLGGRRMYFLMLVLSFGFLN